MPLLNNYHQFEGLHWETGSVRNYFAHCGFKAPHTNEPFTEALLMGISSGVAMGYFSFAYAGYDPHVAILTRNTFSPLETLLARLGVEQNLRQTNNPDRALADLIDCLADGVPPIVWADMFSLPYNLLPHDDGIWQMFPLVVYGYEADTVWLADRARVPLTVTPAELAAARARVKKIKFRLLTLDMPNPDKLAAAVQKGIWDCLKLYIETPPKGSKTNFGLAAFNRWAEVLTQPKQRLSWAKEFPPGRKLYAGLTSAFNCIALFGQDGQKQDAERGMYADFLVEASLILNKPALQEAAAQFRVSAQAWCELAQALLPEHISPFKEIRSLMLRKHRLFLEQGHTARPALEEVNTRLERLKTEISSKFPLTESETAALLENLRSHVLKIHALEQEAVKLLQEAMS